MKKLKFIIHNLSGKEIIDNFSEEELEGLSKFTQEELKKGIQATCDFYVQRGYSIECYLDGKLFLKRQNAFI